MDLESCSQYFCVIHYILYTYTHNIIRTRYRSALALASQRADDRSQETDAVCGTPSVIYDDRHPFATDVG